MRKMVNGVIEDMTQDEIDEYNASQALQAAEALIYARDSEIQHLKVTREASKQAPITVGAHTFDLDEPAQVNINNTIESFEAVRLEAVAQGWPDNGTIPWVLADNSTIPVVSADLQAVKDAGAARGIRLHMEYGMAKAALLAG